MKRATLQALQAARRAKRPVALVADLGGGREQLVYGDALDGLAPELAEAVAEALRTDRARRDGDRFVQPYPPPLRLLVVGAVHVAQKLVPMACAADYDVTVIDPRPAFASAARFGEGVTLEAEWPDEVIERLAPDARTAIVTLTHDPKIDDPGLVAALRSGAFYVGALGSRKTHGKRCARLRDEGFDDAAIARIHGPVGLPLGGRSPAEIAISVMAQITQVLRAPRGDG